MTLEQDEQLMRELLRHAEPQRGQTFPNPLTAAAVVKDGQILAIGVHRKAGEDHAEVAALKQVGAAAKGATLYVNLEPCTHYGKTPPCTSAIIEAGIAEVVFAMEDPNPLVREQGAESMLSAAGIRVRHGVLAREAQQQNRVFVTNICKRRPHVTLKAAVTQDMKLTLVAGEQYAITDQPANHYVHRLRREHDGILVGISTVLVDDPQLNVRYGYLEEGYTSPVKIVLDTYGRCPADAALISTRDAKVILCHGEGVERPATDYPDHVTQLLCPHHDGQLHWEPLLQQLYAAGVCHLMIEGGAQVYASALEAGVVDDAVVFVSEQRADDPTLPGIPAALGETLATLEGDAQTVFPDKLFKIDGLS